MFRFIYRTSIPVLVLIIFGLQVILSSPESYGQGLLKTSDVPGGSGGSTSQPEDTGGSSSTLIIVGGIIIAGLLIYKLVIDKDKPVKEEKQDTTKQESLLSTPKSILSSAISKQAEMTVNIPINIYLGFQNIDPALRERKFIMGVSYNF